MEREGHAPERFFDVMHAAEAPHELLKRQRTAVGAEGHDLAVENERGGREASRARDDVGQARRHVGETARPDRHARTVTVDLHARAVVLVLERRRAFVRGEDRVEVVGNFRQHREQGDEEPRLRAFECRGAAAPRERRHRRDVTEEQRRPPCGIRSGAGRHRDGLQHEAVGDARAHLPSDDPRKVLALDRRGAHGELGEPLFATRAGAGPTRVRDRNESIRDVGQRERGALGLRRCRR